MSPKFLKTVKSKSSVILTMYLGILCGFYFNIGSKKVSKFIRFCSALSFCSITYISYMFLDHNRYLMNHFKEYIVRCLLMFCGCGKRYFNYMTNLDVIDFSIGIQTSYRHFLCSYIFMVFITIEPFLIWIVLSPLCSFSENLIYCSVITMNELNKLYGMMFLESFWHRLKFIRKNMQDDVQNVTYGRGIITSKLQKYLRFYLVVLENFETSYTFLSVQVNFLHRIEKWTKLYNIKMKMEVTTTCVLLRGPNGG